MAAAGAQSAVPHALHGGGASHSRHRQRVAVVSAEPRRMEPGARCAAHIPKINAADVERMARVRNAGRIWDSPHTELDGNTTSWACSKPGQLVLRTPQTLVHHLIGVTCGEPQGGKPQGCRVVPPPVLVLCHCVNHAYQTGVKITLAHWERQ